MDKPKKGAQNRPTRRTMHLLRTTSQSARLVRSAQPTARSAVASRSSSRPATRPATGTRSGTRTASRPAARTVHASQQAALQATLGLLPRPEPAPKRKIPAIQKKKYNKAQLLNEIADKTSLSRKQVQSVFDELEVLIQRHIKKRSVGKFTLPGLLNIETKVRPARPARKNAPKPGCPGEFIDIPRRPQSTRVKLSALKKLNDFAQQP